MSAEYRFLRFDVRDGVARLQFHRPESLNSINREMTTELRAVAGRCADDPSIRVLLMSGAGSAFHGVAAGGGMSIALSADLVVAAESARFTMAYTAQGLTPDGSSTYFLPRLVGFRRAMELMTTNRVLSAAEALDWGIVNEVVPDAEVMARAEALAASLAAGPGLAFAGVKKLLHAGWTESLESQMERETRTITGIAHTKDAHEGIAAFVAKRPATFCGG